MDRAPGAPGPAAAAPFLERPSDIRRSVKHVYRRSTAWNEPVERAPSLEVHQGEACQQPRAPLLDPRSTGGRPLSPDHPVPCLMASRKRVTPPNGGVGRFLTCSSPNCPAHRSASCGAPLPPPTRSGKMDLPVRPPRGRSVSTRTPNWSASSAHLDLQVEVPPSPGDVCPQLVGGKPAYEEGSFSRSREGLPACPRRSGIPPGSHAMSGFGKEIVEREGAGGKALRCRWWWFPERCHHTQGPRRMGGGGTSVRSLPWRDRQCGQLLGAAVRCSHAPSRWSHTPACDPKRRASPTYGFTQLL